MRRIWLTATQALSVLALAALAVHCSAIPSYDVDTSPEATSGLDAGELPDSAAAPADDAGPRDAGADGASGSLCGPTIDPTPPGADDTCRWATPLGWTTGSVRFAKLDSTAFAVTPSYVFVLSHGHLWRMPRGAWLARGGGPLEPCTGDDFGPLAAGAHQLLPFDGDGVCAHWLNGDRAIVHCAGRGQTTLQPVPTLDGEPTDLPPVTGGGRVLTTANGRLIYVRTDGTPYRFSASDTAPQPIDHQVEVPLSLVALTATGGVALASRHCDHCLFDVYQFDPTAAAANQLGSYQWLDSRKDAAALVRVGSTLLARGQALWELTLDGAVRLFDRAETLVGAPADWDSFAVTISDQELEAPATHTIVTPASRGVITPQRSVPALLSDSHNLAIEGDALFVASMPAFGCNPDMAWIAQLPRLLQ